MRLQIWAAVAWRMLVHRKVPLLLSVLAVATGTGFSMANTANLDGYTAELLRQGIGRDAGHIDVTARGVPGQAASEGLGLPGGTLWLSQPQSVAERLRRVPGVQRVAPRLRQPAVAATRRHQVAAPVVGVDPQSEAGRGGLCQQVAVGGCVGADSRSAVVGATLAADLAVRPGDRLRLMVPRETDDLNGDLELARLKLTVVGVLAPGGGLGVDRAVVVPLRALQDLHGQTDAVTSLAVFADDLAMVAEVTDRIERAQPGLQVQPWWRQHAFVARAVEGNRTLSAISTAMAVLAVAIPVLALFYIATLREAHSIAVLLAMGFGRGEIAAIMLLQALTIAGIGGAVGTAMGLGLCSWFDVHPIYASDGFVIRPLVSPGSLLVPAATLLVTTLFASAWPAVLAARSNISQTLRES